MGCGSSLCRRDRRDTGVDELSKIPAGPPVTAPQLGYDDSCLAEFEQQMREREQKEEEAEALARAAEAEERRIQEEREAEEEKQREAEYVAFEKEMEEENRKLLADLSSGRIQQDIFSLDAGRGSGADVMRFGGSQGESPRDSGSRGRHSTTKSTPKHTPSPSPSQSNGCMSSVAPLPQSNMSNTGSGAFGTPGYSTNTTHGGSGGPTHVGSGGSGMPWATNTGSSGVGGSGHTATIQRLQESNTCSDEFDVF